MVIGNTKSYSPDFTRIRRRLLWILTGAGVATLADSALAQGQQQPSAAGEKARRAALEKRIVAYWTARQGSDLGAAYAFYSPEFRAATARPEFLRNYQRLIRFPPEKITIEAIDFQSGGLEAAVRVRLHLHRDFEGQRIPLSGISEESWVFVDRNWWKKDEPLRINV